MGGPFARSSAKEVVFSSWLFKVNAGAITCLQSAFGQFGLAQCFSCPMKQFDYRLGSVVGLASGFDLFVKLTQHLLKSRKVPSAAAVLYGLKLKAKLLYVVSKSRWRHS